MRTPESLRAELGDLNGAIDTFGDRETVQQYPAALMNLEQLEARRAELVNELGNAEISALTVLLEAPGIVGRGDVHADFLANTLGPLQEAISSVGQGIIDRPTDRAPIPGVVRSATQLRVVGMFSGSFGIALAGPRPIQEDFISLFEEEEGVAELPVFDQAVALVLDVIERTGASSGDGSSNEEVLGLLAGIGSRAHHHLSRLGEHFLVCRRRSTVHVQPENCSAADGHSPSSRCRAAPTRSR